MTNSKKDSQADCTSGCGEKFYNEIIIAKNFRAALKWNSGETIDQMRPHLKVSVYINGRIRMFTYDLYNKHVGLSSEEQSKCKTTWTDLHTRFNELIMRWEYPLGYDIFGMDAGRYNKALNLIAHSLGINIQE